MNPPFEPPIDWLIWLIKARQLDALLCRELEQFQLSLGEYEILTVLHQGALPQSHIRKLTEYSLPTVSRRLTRFENEGWVTRELVARDRRRLIVRLTDLGNQHLRAAHTGLDTAVQRLLQTMDKSEATSLAIVHRRIKILHD